MSFVLNWISKFFGWFGMCTTSLHLIDLPMANLVKSMNVLLDLLHSRHITSIILSGDFNVHFEKRDLPCRDLLDALTTFNLTSLVNEATRQA